MVPLAQATEPHESREHWQYRAIRSASGLKGYKPVITPNGLTLPWN
jgi:hypothetical protein